VGAVELVLAGRMDEPLVLIGVHHPGAHSCFTWPPDGRLHRQCVSSETRGTEPVARATPFTRT
jgi:hypothetical protein